MAAVNYAENYQAAIEQAYFNGLHFRALYETPNNKDVKWLNAKTIQVPSIEVDGYTDTNRDSITGHSRRVNNEFTPYTLEHDREFDTLIDPMDIDESNMALSIANTTRVFNTEKKIPEMDKYAASKLYAEVVDKGGKVTESALTVENVLQVFDDMMEFADDNEVPQEGRILYVTPAVNTLLKNAQAIQRSLDVRGENTGVNRQVSSLDDVTIEKVPSSRMKTVYNFDKGAVADPTAKQINMILFHPTCVYSPQKYDNVSLDAPSALSKGKWTYYERKYWDVFLIAKKKAGALFQIQETE